MELLKHFRGINFFFNICPQGSVEGKAEPESVPEPSLADATNAGASNLGQDDTPLVSLVATLKVLHTFGGT